MHVKQRYRQDTIFISHDGSRYISEGETGSQLFSYTSYSYINHPFKTTFMDSKASVYTETANQPAYKYWLKCSNES